MSSLIQILVILLAISTACTTTRTRITSYPTKVGFKRNEYILIGPLERIPEAQSEELMSWARAEFTQKFFVLNSVNYWDAHYNFKQFGIIMPSFNRYDTANFELILKKLNINYILLSTVNGIDENDDEGIGIRNPDYQAREAIISLQLLDLKNRTIVWHCTTRVRASPLTVKSADNTQQYSANVLTAKNYGVNKAFKKSIKRLMAELVVIPQSMI